MAELNDHQLELVAEQLKKAGLSGGSLEDEFFDHLCCAIEVAMAGGQTFECASQEVYAAFGEDEMKKLEAETISLIHQNGITMQKMLISLAALLLLTITTLWAFQTFDPPGRSPVEGNFKITSAFGMRVHPIFKEKRMHKGIDIAGPIGTPIRATSGGIVEKATYHDGYGYMIVIRHDETYQSLYGQMTEDLTVQVGDSVEAGQVIGFMGSSGRSTAPHLHYEVLKDGENVDPEMYLGY